MSVDPAGVNTVGAGAQVWAEPAGASAGLFGVDPGSVISDSGGVGTYTDRGTSALVEAMGLRSGNGGGSSSGGTAQSLHTGLPQVRT